MQPLTEPMLRYVEETHAALTDLIYELAQIPAPSFHEQRRAAFCERFLRGAGAKDVRIDEAGNVICRVDGRRDGPMTVFAAHTDTVFPDESLPPPTIRDGRMYGPSVGDDTASVCALLLTAKYFLAEGSVPEYPVLFVCNACEEGLGNLMGMRALFGAYGGQVGTFYSLDGYYGHVTNNAVGSRRYRVDVQAEGGHSFGDFGHTNAIHELAALIVDLYGIAPPTEARTTYNVGTIEGGISVNSIAQSASALYEFRSEDASCLDTMEGAFRRTLAAREKAGVTFTATLVGERPCKRGVDEGALTALTDRTRRVVEAFTGEPVGTRASSTDSNIPLSMGIPANTVGTVRGGGAHTYGEWIDIQSLKTGLGIVMALVRGAFEGIEI